MRTCRPRCGLPSTGGDRVDLGVVVDDQGPTNLPRRGSY
ncbi:hypothetical protein I552_8361 [Mycobacterium xenopi 3993]|nr:hypothetical protein I552_8361 [Mycobacterium xenopi 3993]